MRALAAVLLMLLPGCTTLGLAEVGRTPELAPIGGGTVPASVPMDVAAPRPVKVSAPGSIWREDAVGLFRDPRAARVGDILTVKIAISDSATLDTKSNRSRTAKSGVGLETNFGFELPFLTTKGKGSGTNSLDGSTSTDGKGGTSRAESIAVQVAAVVSDVMPNGNLIISGSQELLVNYEVRVVTVGGIVRPRDIASDNTISYEKIAEARISYGGRGRIMEVQQPAWGQQIVDRLSPL